MKSRTLAFGIIICLFSVTLTGCLPKIDDKCPTIYPGVYDPSCVGAIQRRLSGLGIMYHPVELGYYQSITIEAVRRFQILAGLSPDGIVGQLTRDKLNSVNPVNWADIYGLLPVCKRAGKPIVCANKTSGVAVLLENGVVKGSSAARFGEHQLDGKGEPTEEGLFVTHPDPKGWAAQSTLFDPPVPVPWFTSFWNGEGFHQSYGFAPGDTSHGCIRLRDMGFAVMVWNYSSTVGLDAMVYQT